MNHGQGRHEGSQKVTSQGRRRGARTNLSQHFHDGLRALLPEALTALRDGLVADNTNTRVRVAATLFRTLRDVGEPGGSINPQAIRVAWQTAESELDLDRRFAIF